MARVSTCQSFVCVSVTDTDRVALEEEVNVRMLCTIMYNNSNQDN